MGLHILKDTSILHSKPAPRQTAGLHPTAAGGSTVQRTLLRKGLQAPASPFLRGHPMLATHQELGLERAVIQARSDRDACAGEE